MAETPAPKWRSERTMGGVVHRKGIWTVLRVGSGQRPWFIARSFMMLGDKRRNVRRFETLAAAKRAADKAMKLPKDQLKPFWV